MLQFVTPNKMCQFYPKCYNLSRPTKCQFYPKCCNLSRPTKYVNFSLNVTFRNCSVPLLAHNPGFLSPSPDQSVRRGSIALTGWSGNLCGRVGSFSITPVSLIPYLLYLELYRLYSRLCAMSAHAWSTPYITSIVQHDMCFSLIFDTFHVNLLYIYNFVSSIVI